MQKWPQQLRKGDVIIEDGQEFPPVVKVVPIMGGSWFDIFVKGQDVPVGSFGHREKLEVK
jgi:hypothetical protein